jgi:hypothetical protein
MGKKSVLSIGTGIVLATSPMVDSVAQDVNIPNVRSAPVEAMIGAELKLTHLRLGPVELFNTAGIHARPIRNDSYSDHRERFEDPNAIFRFPASPAVAALGGGVDIKLNNKNTITAGADYHYMIMDNKTEEYKRTKFFIGNNYKFNLSDRSNASIYTGLFQEEQYVGAKLEYEGETTFGRHANLRRGIELGIGYEKVINRDISFNAKVGYAQSLITHPYRNYGVGSELSASVGLHLRLNPSFKFDIPSYKKRPTPTKGKYGMIPCPPSRIQRK